MVATSIPGAQGKGDAARSSNSTDLRGVSLAHSPEEQAEYFCNRRGARLFGVVSLGRQDCRKETGVLFCHPMGEEKHKSYRSYVKFGRYLAEHGYSSLRFDCEGFGDSEGDNVDATVASMVADTTDAVAHLAVSAGVERVVLAGARFGATLAGLAGAEEKVAGLIQIAPIVSGKAYWNSMLRAHQMSFMTLGMKTKKRQELLDDLVRQGHIEINADLLSEAFVAQLTEVDLVANSSGFGGPCHVSSVNGDSLELRNVNALCDAYRENGNPVTQFLELERDFWSTDSLYDGYEPVELYDSVTRWLEESAG